MSYQPATDIGAWRKKRAVGQPDPLDYRNEFQRDRDRILYSLPFRRLAGITQVAAASEAHLLHNRMSHSLKVAQLGRRMAEKLKMLQPELAAQAFIDEDVVEAAGLAHDLGHPPFGHIGEEALKELLDGCGGFEGNAQTFHIVEKLAHHRSTLKKALRKVPVLGLDLTNATLSAILKYPRPIYAKADSMGEVTDVHWGGHQGKGVYNTEKSRFDDIRSVLNLREGWRTPESVLMDLADDLAYVLHDVEDFYRAGLIPLHKLYKHPISGDHFNTYAYRKVIKKQGYDKQTISDDDRHKFKENIFDPAYEIFEMYLSPFTAPYQGTPRDEDNLKNLVTLIIASTIPNIKLVYLNGETTVEVDDVRRCVLAIIKELTWFYVIERPSLEILQNGYKQVIETVFNRLLMIDQESISIPMQLKNIKDTQKRDKYVQSSVEWLGAKQYKAYFERRAIADFICTLTELQVLDLYQRLTGQTQPSLFGAWFQ